MFRKTLKPKIQKSPDPKKPILFQILPEAVSVKASHDQTVLEALLDAKVLIHHSCGGMGTCGTCVVDVIQGFEKLEPKTDQEIEISSDRNWQSKERLCCQIHPQDGLVLKKNYST